jgi:acyl carrier protein
VDKFIENLIELLDEKPQFEIDPDTVFKELPGWDSLVALSLIVMISNNYGKSINGEVIRNCVTIQDLFEVVNA